MCQTSEEMSTMCGISSKNLENNSVYNGYNQNHDITQRDKSLFSLSFSRQGLLCYLISEVRDWNIHEEAQLSGVHTIKMFYALNPKTFIIFFENLHQETNILILGNM